MSEEPRDDQRHIWHTATPRASSEPTTGKRVLAIAFVLLVVVVVVVALLLVVTGTVSTDAPTPQG